MKDAAECQEISKHSQFHTKLTDYDNIRITCYLPHGDVVRIHGKLMAHKLRNKIVRRKNVKQRSSYSYSYYSDCDSRQPQRCLVVDCESFTSILRLPRNVSSSANSYMFPKHIISNYNTYLRCASNSLLNDVSQVKPGVHIIATIAIAQNEFSDQND